MDASDATDDDGVGSDAGDDDDDPAPRARQRNKGDGRSADVVRTVGQALDRVREGLRRQIVFAHEERSTANVAVSGDARVRNELYMLLNDEAARRCFLEIASDATALTRVRPLFGAPPYGFLRPGEASLLRAAGFAHGRANMVDEVGYVARSYSQFGYGQLEDDYERLYRVVDIGRLDESDAISCLSFGSQRSNVALQVRLRRRARTARRRLERDDEGRKRLRFPLVGERVVVRLSKRMRAVTGSTTDEDTGDHTLQIVRVVPRASSALTAAMLVTVV